MDAGTLHWHAPGPQRLGSARPGPGPWHLQPQSEPLRLDRMPRHATKALEVAHEAIAIVDSTHSSVDCIARTLCHLSTALEDSRMKSARKGPSCFGSLRVPLRLAA